MKPAAAVVGAGLMGEWHARALSKAGGRLSAVVDIDMDRARKLAASYRPARAFTSLDALFGENGIQVVHLCSPLETHYALAKLALEKGAHVLVEKPVAATPFEVQALIDLAAASGKHLTPVYQFAFQQGLRWALRERGRIGRLVALEARIASAGADGLDGIAQDRVTVEILPHPLSLMRQILGKAFNGADWQVSKADAGEFRATGRCSGVMLSITISMHARPTENTFLLAGEQGSLHCDLFHGSAYYLSGRVSRLRKALLPFENAAWMAGSAGINLLQRFVKGQAAYPGLWELTQAFYQAVRGEAGKPFQDHFVLDVETARAVLLDSWQSKLEDPQ